MSEQSESGAATRWAFEFFMLAATSPRHSHLPWRSADLDRNAPVPECRSGGARPSRQACASLFESVFFQRRGFGVLLAGFAALAAARLEAPAGRLAVWRLALSFLPR